MPYTMPKFTALALERIWLVTISVGIPNTRAAVEVWMSLPSKKSSRMAASSATWASTRSSIWE